MPAALVQSRALAFSATAAASTALAYTSNVSAGTLLLAFASWDITAPATTTTLADSRTNTETALPQHSDATNAQAGQMWRAASNGAGADTVTATHSASITSRELAIAEFSGVDTAAHASNGVAAQVATTTPATGSITTTARCLVVSFLNNDGQQVVSAVPSGFTSLTTGGASSVIATAYAVLAPGTYNPTWTTASGRYNGDTIAFRELLLPDLVMPSRF